MTDTDTVKRPAPPDLEFRCPDCPFCDRELTCDGDSFFCESEGCAKATWDRSGQHGEWDEPDAPRCESTIKPFDAEKYPSIGDTTYQCLFEDGHDGKHNHPEYDEWTDASPYLTAPPKGTVGLVTIQFGVRDLLSGLSSIPSSVSYIEHLVREDKGGGRKEILCGKDRFNPREQGWSIGGGVSGPDVKVIACPGCHERAVTLFADFKVHGIYADLFRQPVSS